MIESLKNIVITLVTVLIFISAVEIITPDNKMKKYIRFVLGLILITVILNPILQFISSGEKSVIDNIKSYEEVFSENEAKADLQNINNETNNRDAEDGRKKAFINNFNKNCDNLLKNKFKDMTFKSEVDCDIDFNKISFNVKKLRIEVNDNKVKKVKKIVINDEEKSNTKVENGEYEEVRDYISSELSIPKEKIEVYKFDKEG